MKSMMMFLSLVACSVVCAQPPITKQQALEAHAAASAKVLLWVPTLADYNTYKTLTVNYLSETTDLYEDEVKPAHGQQQGIETKLANAQKKIDDPDATNIEDADSQIDLAQVSREVGDEAFIDAATAFNEKDWTKCYNDSLACIAAYDIAYDYIGEASFYLGQAEETTSDAESDCFDLLYY